MKIRSQIGISEFFNDNVQLMLNKNQIDCIGILHEEKEEESLDRFLDQRESRDDFEKVVQEIITLSSNLITHVWIYDETIHIGVEGLNYVLFLKKREQTDDKTESQNNTD